MQQHEASSSGSELHLINFCSKFPLGEPKIINAITKAISCASHTNDKALQLKTTTTELVEHREIKPMLPQAFTLTGKLLLYQNVLYMLSKDMQRTKHLQTHRMGWDGRGKKMIVVVFNQ